MAEIEQAQLESSAQDWARRAFDAYLLDDRAVVLVNAAMAHELLSKAFLHSRNPALLADLGRKDFDSLLQLCGFGNEARSGHRTKTVSGTEAMQRAHRLLPDRSTPTDLLATLIEIRNGAVHAGQLPASEIHEVLAAFVTECVGILTVMGKSPEGFFGEHADLMSKMQEQASGAIEHETHRKVAAARQNFQRLIQQLPEEQVDRLIEQREADADYNRPDDEDVETVRCPGCQTFSALCFGRREEERGSDGPCVIFRAHRLNCPVCYLKIDGSDQLAIVGVSAAWEVSPNLFELFELGD